MRPLLNPRSWREIFQLKRDLVMPATPLAPEIIDVGTGKIVWKIFLTPTKSVFVSQSTPNYGKKFVAYIHAGHFYRAWRLQTLLNPGESQGCPRVEDMVKDYKYLSAGRGFAHGLVNPVPLPDIDFFNGIGFTDGITRTMWLISNGAQAFPVSTGSEESGLLLARKFGISPSIICLQGIL